MGVVTRGWLALTLCACRAEALDREPLTEIAALQSISRTASLSSRRFTASVKALRTKRLNAARPPRPAASMTPRRRDLSSAWKQDAFRASKLEKACVVRSSKSLKSSGDLPSDRPGTGSTVIREVSPPILRKTSISITHHRREWYVGPARTNSSRHPAKYTGRFMRDSSMACWSMHPLSSHTMGSRPWTSSNLSAQRVSSAHFDSPESCHE
mmetsp:Transcript_22197/g.67395  ORF Transcript_22197/g.67395 Transcript_22197/m.67395 type:complete len:211 (+) Transcript_22197:723-1355(+)